MTDILSQLHPLSWRGVGPLPMTSRDFGFQHDQSKHRFIFVRQELIESLGRQNPTYRYTIPFREDIFKGPYENLFTVTYPQFFDACVDDTDAFLVDPVRGERQCKCVAFREVIDVDKRDGIDVEVDFIESPDEASLEDETVDVASIEGAKGLAGLFDRDIEKIDWQQETPPPTTVNVFDAISGVANQLEVAANKPNALIEDQILRMQNVHASIERLEDPKTAPAAQRARLMELALHDMRKTSPVPVTKRGPVTRTAIVASDMGIIALAGKYGMSVSDFLRLNPQHQGKTTITARSRIFYQR
jgi:hypothetical protein